jgi:hypothetical protein
MPRTPSQRQPRRMAIAAAIVMVFALAAGALLWPHATTDVVAAVRFEARLAEAVPTLGLRPVRVAHSDRTIYLHDGAIVTNSDIASARVVPGDGDTFNVAIQFTAQGEAKMLSATRTHIGRPIAILLDGDVVMAPTVRSAIGNAATITGSFPKNRGRSDRRRHHRPVDAAAALVPRRVRLQPDPERSA